MTHERTHYDSYPYGNRLPSALWVLVAAAVAAVATPAVPFPTL